MLVDAKVAAVCRLLCATQVAAAQSSCRLAALVGGLTATMLHSAWPRLASGPVCGLPPAAAVPLPPALAGAARGIWPAARLLQHALCRGARRPAPLPPLSSRLLSHWCAWAGALFVVQEDPNFVEALASECARLMVTTCHAFTSYRSRSTLLLAAAPNAGAGRCRMAGWACWLCCGRTSPSRCTCWRKCAKLGAAFRQRLLFGGQYARACRGVLPWRWLDCA